jgi:hypothetical protein
VVTHGTGSTLSGLATLLIAAAVLVGCGTGEGIIGGGGTIPPPSDAPTGGLLVQIQDAPVDNLLKFEITVVSIELDPGDVEVLPQPVRVELTSLQLATGLIQLAADIPTGSYSSVTAQFSDPEIKFCLDPPFACSESLVQERQPDLTNMTVTKDLSFSITEDSTRGLLLDFDLEASLLTDAVGAITEVDPVVTCTVVNLDTEDDELEAKGKVISIDRTTATTGTFVLEVFGSCQRLTVSVDSSTDYQDFDGAGLTNDFDGLAVDQIVEVDADGSSDGSLLASRVELEDPDDDEEAEGIITDATRDFGGDVTEFTLVVQEVASCAVAALTEDIITVTVDSNTELEVDTDLPGVTENLFNDPGELAVGQKVEVEPVGLLAADITAEKIKLSDQTIRGTVFSTAPPSFSLLPDSTIFEDANPFITVQTSSATEFDGASGVAELANREVRVRGLLFLIAGQLTLEAEKVDATP